MFEREPLSIVDPQPISTLSSIITIPIWGYLKFEPLFGKKPKPFFPITQPSKILTLSLTMSLFTSIEKKATHYSPGEHKIIHLWHLMLEVQQLMLLLMLMMHSSRKAMTLDLAERSHEDD